MSAGEFVYTYFGERSSGGKWRSELSALQLGHLSDHYQLKFNSVTIIPRSDMGMIEYPDADLIDARFNLSGDERLLLHHGFVHREWLGNMPRCGVRNMLRAEGFGRASQLVRTARGYRLAGARYDDPLPILAPLLPMISSAAARFCRLTI